MKRFYRKALIYLLAVAMVAPAWLANGMFSATKASAHFCTKPTVTAYVSDSVINKDDIGDVLDITIDFSKDMDHDVTPIVELSPPEAFHLLHAEWRDDDLYKLSYLVNDVAQESAIAISVSEAEDGCEMNPAVITGKLRIDTIAPILTGVSISSNNINTSWAKVGDTITLEFTASEAIKKPHVHIFNNCVSVDQVGIDGKKYEAEYITKPTDSELPAPISFQIFDPEDFAWNEIDDVIATTDDSSVTFDKTDPSVTVNPLTSNQKKPVVTGTVDDPMATISINVAGADYPALNNGDGTWTGAITTEIADGTYEVLATATDLAGNSGQDETSNELTINATAPAVPMNLVAVAGNGEVSLSWDAVAGASGYVISYKKTSDSVFGTSIPVTGTSTKIINLSNGVSYDFRVAAIGSNGVEGAQATTTASPVAPKTVSAVTTAPVVMGPVASIAPATVQAAPAEQKVETPSDDNGQIKGEEENTSEKEDINWTPWIVLFVLILLAGAATGGYFYWFAGSEDEENKPAPKEEKQIEKKVVATKKNGSKAPNRKSKRW